MGGLLSSQFLSLPVQGNEYSAWIDKGRILYSQGAYREAFDAFTKIDKPPPTELTDELLYLSANSLMETGSYEEAESLANAIRDKSPVYPFALYTRALINLRTGKDKIAEDYLEEITKYLRTAQAVQGKQLRENDIRPGDIDKLLQKTNITLGFICLEKGDYDRSLRHFSAVPKESPFYEKALFGLGWTYARMERWVRSVVIWEELFASYPDSPYSLEVVPYIGYSYTRLNAYGKAAEQNGVAIRYYRDQMAKIRGLKNSLRRGDFDKIAEAVNRYGDNEMNKDLNLYKGLLKMEEYIGKPGRDISPEAESLVKSSIKARTDLLDGIYERLQTRLEQLLKQLLDTSIDTTLVMAQNLRMEGGGQISSEMIFMNHD